MSKARLLAFAIVIMCLLWTMPTGTAAVYSITFDGPSNINAGDSFSLDVYLTEQIAPGELFVLGDSTQGLIAGNFQVRIVSGGSQISKITGNMAFDTYGGEVTNSPWILNQSDIIVADGTPHGELVATGTYRLRLGTILGTGSLSTETTYFEIIDPSGLDPNVTDMMLGDGTSLDTLVFPSAQFALATSGSGSNVVPEPISVLVWGLGGVATIIARRKGKNSRLPTNR